MHWSQDAGRVMATYNGFAVSSDPVVAQGHDDSDSQLGGLIQNIVQGLESLLIVLP